MILSVIISIGLPVGLCLVAHKRCGVQVVPLLLGVAGFVFFVLILEQSIHLIVFSRFALRENPFLFVLYGIFMAGIFEETARFISFHILKKKYRGISVGISYGIGHGGSESILIVGLSMISTLTAAILINTGQLEIITGRLQGATLEQVNAQIHMLTTLPSYSFLAGGIERIFALGIHLSCSVLVFYAVYGTGKCWLYPLAILLHAMVNIPAALMQAGIIKNMFLTELFVFLGALLTAMAAIYTHEKLKTEKSLTESV
ncbi:MAG: YhfC family intramembrane metalloprotease [Tannerella sp.]|nr:YhfC family intramembrane metalloprotease [Tannerella sp.]